MPFVDPWLARGQSSSPIAHAEREYDRTKNPIHVWRALRDCNPLLSRGIIDALPEWVHEYLAGVADDMDVLFYQHQDREGTDLGRDLGVALGFLEPGRGKRLTAFDRDRVQRRDYGLAMAVGRCMKDLDVPYRKAAQIISEQSDGARNEYLEACKDPETRPPIIDPPPAISQDMLERAWERYGDDVTE